MWGQIDERRPVSSYRGRGGLWTFGRKGYQPWKPLKENQNGPTLSLMGFLMSNSEQAE